MEIYSTYQIAALISGFFSKNWAQLFTYSIGIGLIAWLVFFILQGVGLSTMAKNGGIKNKWMAFVPFVNIWYIGKLAGECQMFGHKVKRIGVYAMVAQIIATLITVATIVSEAYLYVNHGEPILPEITLAKPYWPNLTGFSKTVEVFYIYSDFLLWIFQLAFGVLMLILMTALCKKYTPKNHMGLSMLAFFIPLSRFIVIFCIRKNKAVDYEAYVRQKREEFMRRQQQYRNMYGNPNGGNPYSNPYGNPYNRGQNPYGNPYNQNQSNAESQKPQEEPFAEFASNNKQEPASSNEQSTNDTSKNDSNSDGIFN